MLQDCHLIVQVAVKLMLGRCEQELALRAGMVSRAGSVCNLTPFSQVCLLPGCFSWHASG